MYRENPNIKIQIPSKTKNPEASTFIHMNGTYARLYYYSPKFPALSCDKIIYLCLGELWSFNITLSKKYKLKFLYNFAMEILEPRCASCRKIRNSSQKICLQPRTCMKMT